MKTIGFNKNMLLMINELINNNLEYIIYEVSNHNKSFGDLSLNFNNKLLKITNYEDMHGWDDEYDSSHFSCEFVDKYIPSVSNATTNKININDKVIDINIIYDEITNKYYHFNYDMALEIKTEKHTYIISRDYFYSELISINIDKNFDEIYPISKVIEDWNEDSNYVTEIKRNKINIKERLNNN